MDNETDNQLPDSQAQGTPAGEQSTEPTSPNPTESAPVIDDPRFQGKSAKDIYDAYRNLESHLGERDEEAKLAKSIVERIAREQNISTEEAKWQLKRVSEQQTTQDQFQNQPNYLAEELVQIKLSNEFRDLKDDIPEVTPFRDTLISLKKQSPSSSMKEIWNETFAKAFETGKKAAFDKQEEKETAQVTTSSKQLVQPQDTSGELAALKKAVESRDDNARQKALSALLSKKGLTEDKLWGNQ